MTPVVMLIGSAALIAAAVFLRHQHNKKIASNKSASAEQLPSNIQVPSAISATVTDQNRRLENLAPISWQTAPTTASTPDQTADKIVIDSAKQYQSVVGFGGAFTDAACHMFNQLDGQTREKLFHQLFHPSALNLSLNRTCIGSSDYATKLYSYDEGEADPELKRFSLDHDRQYILPMLQQALTVNPDIFLFSSPWSPPGWMKSNGSMLGGNIQRKHMPAYAQYFVKFIQGYAEAGVPVRAVTVQNEVDTDQDGKMPACAWPQEYEVDFVRWHLGPALVNAGLKTNVWIIDHNYNLWGRALASLEEPHLRDYATAIAWHGYVGDPGKMSLVHDAYPSVDAFWTEGGPDYTDPRYGTDWSKWSRTFTGNLRNWCRGITVWNLALDEAGRPNIGPFPCGGLVTINSESKAISYSGQFYALAQYSKFVRRGAKRIDSTGNISDVSHVAFQNENGEKVVVLTNSGVARSVTIAQGGAEAVLDLSADSVTTLVFN